MPLEMTAQDIKVLFDREFPQVADDFVVESLAERAATVRLCVREKHLRPGGTVSGPSIFALADCAVYIAILASIGPRPLAVTTGGSVDFMRKPAAHTDLIAHCRLLKLGRLLAVGDVLIYSEGRADPVARASMTYSIPPET